MTIAFPELGVVGRLGNQLYQLAATIGIARRLGQEPRFPLWDYQPYFSFPDELFVDNPAGAHPSSYAAHIDERARIYLQDAGLFADVLDEIRAYCAPSALAHGIFDSFEFFALRRPILGMHVRRGDNVPGADLATPEKWRYHVCPGLEYYTAALAVVPEHASLAVFSDDIEWCEANLAADYFHHGTPRPKELAPGYFDPPLDWVDWHLLATCDSFVLSNSTFGVFAGYLADKPTIVPSPFFGPDLDYIDARLLWAGRDWTELPC